jgi:hypothetical protein
MAAATPVVAVEGFNALQRDLRKLGDDVSGPILDAIRDAGYKAAQPVMLKARAAWPHVTGAHGDSLRIIRVRSGATIAEGGKADKVGGTGWLEFGGDLHGGFRPFVSGGRWLFPSAQSLASTVAQLYGDAIQRVLDKGSSWSNTTTDAAEVTDG